MLTAAVIVLGATAPWVRSWTVQRWIVASTMATGALIIAAVMLARNHFQRAAAQRRGGRRDAVLQVPGRWLWGGIYAGVGVLLSFYFVASSPDADAQLVTHWLSLLLFAGKGGVSGGLIVLSFIYAQTVEIRQQGLVIGRKLLPWRQVIARAWPNETTVILTFDLPSGHRYMEFRVAMNARATIEAILADKVPGPC